MSHRRHQWTRRAVVGMDRPYSCLVCQFTQGVRKQFGDMKQAVVHGIVPYVMQDNRKLEPAR